MSLSVGEVVTIPSPIDVHVHLREPGGEDKETIASGTTAARAGGYQAVYDMPNNPGRPTWTEERLDEKIAIARHTAKTAIGFYAGVDLENPSLEEFSGMVQKAAGLKLYMGHTTGNTIEHNLETARPAIDEWIKQARNGGRITPILLHARESIGFETADYIASQNYPVHWCHVSTKREALDSMHLQRLHPYFFTAGVTPHHLTMTARNADFQQGWNGARMQPPLGQEVDADRLLRSYNDGYIAILETDHAPHTETDKLRAETENPSGETDPDCVTCFGVSGIEFVLPVMTSLVRRNLTSMDRVVDSLYDQPKRMLQLGAATMRKKTDLEIEPYIIEEDNIMGNSRNTPYIGWTASAHVIQTY